MRYWSKTRAVALVLTFIFMLSSPVYTFGFSLFKKEPKPIVSVPDLKMYTVSEEIPLQPNGKNIFVSGGTQEEAARLSDGDTKTATVAKTPMTVTLDLGELYMLAGVRLLPSSADGSSVNRCIGTEVSVSVDNRVFYDIGKIQPADGGEGCYEDWLDIFSQGVGEYRYIRIKIPAGAAIAEMRGLTYPDWTYTSKSGGKVDLHLKLQAFDVKKDINGTIIAAVYNSNGILKKAQLFEQNFQKDVCTEVELVLDDIDKKVGDSYRILIWDENGKWTLTKPLEYNYDVASSGFTVSNIFSDNMLLQCDKPLTIWGNAPVGQEVEVTIENVMGGKAQGKTKTGNNSQWSVEMGSFSKGGEYTILVRSGTEKKKFKNITFGDIWLCIGQSNMEYYMLASDDTKEYLNSDQGKAEVNNPKIRVLNLFNKGISGAGAGLDNIPLNYGETAWMPMQKDTANYCSSVAYFFAQEIQREFDIPVGIINSAVGDTEINRWIEWGKTYGSFTSTDGGLYFNRVAPFERLQIRGILMYQGEADQYRTALTASQYRDALSGLIDDYRSVWGADLPFYWAQLTRHKKDESLIREGQRLAFDKIKTKKNAGIVPLIDLYGEYEVGTGNCREDIHPHQKKEVAQRFALYAKRDVYGKTDTIANGPVYKSMRILGNKIELTFDCTGSLKIMPKEQYADEQTDKLIKQKRLNAQKLQEFEIAGADGIFVRADAVADGNKVILSSKDISNPVAARYGWGAYPEMPNLTDDSGLPALTFTTETLQ